MSKNKVLFKVPKKDIKDDLPHFKNNVYEPNVIHQADLLFLPTSEFGYKYALVVSDVFNNKIDAIALKDKNSMSIRNGLIKIYGKEKPILEYPFILTMDSGSEFKNKDVKDFLKEYEIRPKYNQINRHRQNAIVENANFRLGKLILEEQAEKELETGKISKSWHKQLDKYIDILNKKVRKNKNVYDPLEDVKSNSLFVEMLNEGDKVRKILDYPISAHNKKRVDNKFRAGDIRWSPEEYKIMHIIINPNMPILYMLNKKGFDNSLDTSTAYTRNQLQLI